MLIKRQSIIDCNTQVSKNRGLLLSGCPLIVILMFFLAVWSKNWHSYTFTGVETKCSNHHAHFTKSSRSCCIASLSSGLSTERNNNGVISKRFQPCVALCRACHLCEEETKAALAVNLEALLMLLYAELRCHYQQLQNVFASWAN